MLPNHFFHPYHIKPLSEFITAVMKMSDLSKSHIVMETYAVIIKISSLLYRAGNTCIHIKYTHIFKFLFKYLVQCLANTHSLTVIFYINCCFNGPVISPSVFKACSICISDYFSFMYSFNIRIFCRNILYSFFKFIF